MASANPFGDKELLYFDEEVLSGTHGEQPGATSDTMDE